MKEKEHQSIEWKDTLDKLTKNFSYGTPKDDS